MELLSAFDLPVKRDATFRKYFNLLKSRPQTACPIILHYYVIRYTSYYLLTHVIEGKAVGTRRRGKKSKQLLDRWKIEESWQGQESTLFSNASRLALQPMQPSVECVRLFQDE